MGVRNEKLIMEAKVSARRGSYFMGGVGAAIAD
jgi:hypothetical protein